MPTVDHRASAGGSAVVYRLWQVAGAVEQLVASEASEDTLYDRRVVNALVESALIDLRALIGFLLAESTVEGRRVVPKSNDVRPSWFNSALEDAWSPSAPTARALRYFFDAVSGSVAHAPIRIKGRHPGDWPEREALLVVATELERLLVEVGSPGTLRLRIRRQGCDGASWRTLSDVTPCAPARFMSVSRLAVGTTLVS